MARTKDIKLPKYLRLAKGMMWMDIDGPNSSGVRLHRAATKFVGRGFIKDNENDIPEVPEDHAKNQNSMQGQYGWVDAEDNSYFCTTDIPKEKMGRILTAYQNGILVAFNPTKEETKVVGESAKQDRNFRIDKDGDIVFVGSNQAMYKKLSNSTFESIFKFIQSCDERSYANLMDLYEYELKGYNPLSRPRFEVLQAVRKKLNSFGPSMTAIRVNEDEDVRAKIQKDIDNSKRSTNIHALEYQRYNPKRV